MPSSKAVVNERNGYFCSNTNKDRSKNVMKQKEAFITFAFTKSKSVQPKRTYSTVLYSWVCVSEFKLRTPQLPSDSLSKEVKINERKSKWSFTVYFTLSFGFVCDFVFLSFCANVCVCTVCSHV